MPLAWYSSDTEQDEKRVYHVCLKCQHNPKIKPENLVILSTQDNIRELTQREVCEDCEEHERNAADWRINFRHSSCRATDSQQIEKVISQEGR